MCSLNITW